MAPRGWRVRNLALSLSQPGFEPSYGKLLSCHTDEFWLNETDLSVVDYRDIYVYMYVCVYVCVCVTHKDLHALFKVI